MSDSMTDTNNKAIKFGAKPAKVHSASIKPKKLPKHAKKAASRGLISPKQMAKMRGVD